MNTQPIWPMLMAPSPHAQLYMSLMYVKKGLNRGSDDLKFLIPLSPRIWIKLYFGERALEDPTGTWLNFIITREQD